MPLAYLLEFCVLTIMFGKGEPYSTYYYGSDTYKHIDDLIERGREILMVSPYVDRYYAEKLLEYSKGRRLYLISSSMDSEALRLLQGTSSIWAIAYLSLSSILLALLLYIRVPSTLLALSLIPIIVGSIKNLGRKRIMLKVPKQFVHAKMYISDSTAITGSANLTYKGTHRNLEQISITRSKGDVEKLKKQFWELWSKL